MLKISEHYEFYNRDYSAITDRIGYFDMQVQDFEQTDEIELGNDQKLTILISKKEGEKNCKISSSYFIGLDIFKKLNLPVYVESKLNDGVNRIDYVRMLIEALQEPENFNHLDGLLITKMEEEWITIEQNMQPLLTPFLIAQFLYAVKSLVKKGLKKAYYKKTENLTNRVKGKILIGAQIKQNILKNRITKTACSYQEYGFDTEVNRFLKFVLDLVSSQIYSYGGKELKKNLEGILHYNKGGFQMVSYQKFSEFQFHESNPFYKNYNLAIDLGNQILKLQDKEISSEIKDKKLHPPFWIDMAKLFELFVFKKLRKDFGENVFYHEKHNKQEPDFLIKDGDFKAVVDAKYKPRYKVGNPTMEDARQLAGYARLNSIYERLEFDPEKIIPTYFIYPKELKSEIEQDSLGLLEFFNDEKIPNAGMTLNNARLSSNYKQMFLKEISVDSKAVIKRIKRLKKHKRKSINQH